MTYTHRQIGWIYIVPIAVILVPFLLIAMIAQRQLVLGIGLTLVLALVYGSFATLNTRIDGRDLKVGWTFGWPGRRIPLGAIVSHQPVRNRWWYGWGVRPIPGGMLHSVWGLDAVEIRYRDAKRGKERMFRVGSDDVAGLDSALTAARDQTPRRR